MIVKFKKLDPRAVIPTYQSIGASGFDLHAIENVTIWALEKPTMVRTGLAVELPQPYEGFHMRLEMQIRPRSGLSINSGLVIVNSPGTIDSDYRGEIMIGMRFFPHLPDDPVGGSTAELFYEYLNDSWNIAAGDRVAQAIICPVFQADISEVTELSDTKRGAGGFGSTGV